MSDTNSENRVAGARAYIKPINNKALIEKIMEETIIINKERLREILEQGSYSQFKNDVGFMPGFEYTIRGGMPTFVAQYKLPEEAMVEIRATIQ